MASGTANPGLSWPVAVVRACSPSRLILSAGGLATSVFLCALILAQTQEVPVRLAAWWQDPLVELERLGREVVGAGGRSLFRLILLAVVLSIVWGLAGCWIVRAELLHIRGRERRDYTSPTALVLGRIPALCFLLPMCLFAAGSMLTPGLFTGLFNRVPFLGAILVSLSLPVLFLFALFSILFLLGTLAFPLMPAAIAAEGSDHFDAISRAYSYFYQQALRYAFWFGLSLAISALPSLGIFLLLRSQPGAIGPAIRQPLVAAGAVLSVSLFWSLQGLVYLKMRRAIDNVEEDEIWTGSLEEETTSAQSETGAPGGEEPATLREDTETPAVPVVLGGPFTFVGALRACSNLDVIQQLVLLGAALWVGLVLVVGAWATRSFAGVAAQGPTIERSREAVLDLAGQNPALLSALGLGTVYFATAGIARMSRMAARMSAVRVVTGRNLTIMAATGFTRQARWQGVISAALFASGLLALLAAGCLVPLTLSGGMPWPEPTALGGVGVGLVALGAIGLGVGAVEAGRGESARRGSPATILGNAPETLALALAGLMFCCLHFAVVLGLAWAGWALACESLSWLGGQNVQWMRWGLTDQVLPTAEPGFDRLASWIAGFWFFLIFGLVLVYPLAFAQRWGVACYLLARQRDGDAPADLVVLTEVERVAIEARGRRPQLRRRDLQKGRRPQE
jgi:hypothetical protein